MGQLNVLKPDTAISVNGVTVHECDMSGLPDDFWGLVWDGTIGQVEYNGSVKPNLFINSEAEIEAALGVSHATLIARHETARAALGQYNPLNDPLMLGRED